MFDWEELSQTLDKSEEGSPDSAGQLLGVCCARDRSASCCSGTPGKRRGAEGRARRGDTPPFSIIEVTELAFLGVKGGHAPLGFPTFFKSLHLGTLRLDQLKIPHVRKSVKKRNVVQEW